MAKVKRRFGDSAIDWFAVWIALTSFIFLIAWQSWPDSDYMDEALPILFRTILVSTPLTLGMWGVTRATRRGSAVPGYMSRKLPYGEVSPDGSIGGTTWEDAHKGTPPTPIGGENTDDTRERETSKGDAA